MSAKSVLFLFKFEGLFSVKQFCSGTDYRSLVDFVCSRYDSLNSGNFSLTYKLPNYGECFLDDDDDFGALLELVRQLSMQRLEITVSRKECDAPETSDVVSSVGTHIPNSLGEKTKRKIKCGKCNEIGNHNRKTCTK
ncbi:hypothetical protein ABFS83_13G011100 [Erythranthe nasuta]